MRKFAPTLLALLLTLLALLLTLPAVADDPHEGDGPWFEPENCDICRFLTAEPGLMDALVWENHEVGDGILTIAIIPTEFRDAYMRARHGINDLGGQMMSGQIDPRTLHLCGHCEALVGLMIQGAQMQILESERAGVEISLLTADDPTLVTRIQEYSARNDEEMVRYMAAHGR
jgi:hypothetical protein